MKHHSKSKIKYMLHLAIQTCRSLKMLSNRPLKPLSQLKLSVSVQARRKSDLPYCWKFLDGKEEMHKGVIKSLVDNLEVSHYEIQACKQKSL